MKNPQLVITFGKYKVVKLDLIEFLATAYGSSKSVVRRKLNQKAKLSMGILYETD